MEVKVFGIVKEIVGGAAVSVTNAKNVGELKAALATQYPRLQQLSSFMIAVNGEYANNDTMICEGYEVAVIPPVSGG